MSYQRHFKLADDMIAHLDTIIGTVADPFVSSRYVGFVAVTAVTVYELAIKDIFINFGAKKHKVLGAYTQSNFDRINGRVKLSNIRDDYVKKFGDKYLQRFNRKLEKLERETLQNDRVSLKATYNNIVVWRNEFAHAGQIPSFATYQEVTKGYQIGKRLLECLSETMQR
jgi:hypothetical protein